MKKSQIVIPFVAVFAVFSILAGLDHPTTVSAESSGTPYSAEWKITGPTGGDVRGLVVDPNNADRFYFGTLDGQIYTSADGGKHWELLHNFNRPKLFVDHIVVDPRDSRTLYVAAHRHKESGGFFKSTDSGHT